MPHIKDNNTPTEDLKFTLSVQVIPTELSCTCKDVSEVWLHHLQHQIKITQSRSPLPCWQDSQIPQEGALCIEDRIFRPSLPGSSSGVFVR